MILLKDATESLLIRINNPHNNPKEQRIYIELYLENIARWGDRVVTDLKREEAKQESKTHIVLIAEVPVKFRVDYDGDIELMGIAEDDSREIAAVKAGCLAYLENLNKLAEENRAGDIGMERGQRDKF